MKYIRTFFVTLCAASVMLLFTPLPVRAITGGCNFPGCFGGDAVYEYVCTCSGEFLVTFGPYFTYGAPYPTFGDLSYQPGSIAYQTYDILPSEAVLGTYVPGVPGCWIYAGTTCVPIEPQNGTILPFTGVSYPGGATL